jgi:L-arabinokinase
MQENNSQGNAPARLDILGGIADYSGALVIEAPLDIYTKVSIVSRSDNEIHLKSGLLDYQFDLSTILPFRGEIISRRAWEVSDAPKWSLYVLGCLFVLLDEYEFEISGLDIIVESQVPIGSGLSSSAALEMATLSAFRSHYNLDIPDIKLALFGQKAENKVVGAPCGIMDQLAVQVGQQGYVLPIICRPHDVLPPTKIPEEVQFFALDTGVRHDNSGSSYASVRTASLMGLRIISSYKKVEFLADLTLKDFLENFEKQLPSEIGGEEFINTYGDIEAGLVKIDPAKIYLVKSCASFPIYENDRSHQFLELLKAETADKDALGKLMLASHEGYQNCGISCPEADFLVSLVKKTKGAYGARITGGGSGGSVAILADDLSIVSKIQDAFYEKYKFRSKIEQTKNGH